MAAPPEQAHSQTLVGCGHSLPDQQVLVVHPETLLPCAPGEVGEVWVEGPSVAQGYWGRPEDTAATSTRARRTGEGPFLRTGDLGFLRRKRRALRHRPAQGPRHHPRAQPPPAGHRADGGAGHPALRPGCGAAFSVEVEGEERLVLVYEADTRRQPVEVREVARAVSQRVAEAHELQLHALTLIEPGQPAQDVQREDPAPGLPRGLPRG